MPRKRIIPVSGLKFHRLTLLHRIPESSKKHPKWLCQCDCGTIKEIHVGLVTREHTKSCGCLSKEVASEHNSTHGHSRGYKRTKTYAAWSAMRRRCYDPKNSKYHRYGGRGISVCDAWLNSFENFLQDMGEAPENMSLDRINNNGNYTPENCRWATQKEQVNNRNVPLYTFNNETRSLKEWSKLSGVSEVTLRARLRKNLSAEEVLSTVNLRYGHPLQSLKEHH